MSIAVDANISNKQDEEQKQTLPIETIEFPPDQRYTGCFLHNNLHGVGLYVFNRDEQNQIYDCLLYCNKIEGYGHIFYKDGSHFQGLFRDNERFGPGVFTYENRQQDVGLWEGFSLIRLSTVVGPAMVPSLGTTNTGKLKILKYRHMVHVCHERMDRAKDIMINLGADIETLKKSEVLYSTKVKDKNYVFFNSYKYDEYFFPNNDCEIEVLEKVQPHRDSSRKTDGNRSILMQRHQKRIAILTDKINEIKPKLTKIRETLKTVTEKIEFCRSCCYSEDENSECASENVRSVSQKSSHTNTDDDRDTVAWSSITDGSLAVDASLADRSLMTLSTADFNDSSQVSVSNKSPTQAGSTTTNGYLNSICYCDEEMAIDNLAILEEQQRQLQRDEVFYSTLVENLEPKLERHLEAVNKSPLNTKRIVVDKLLAWNNDKICKQMVKHGFIHRHSECMVNFLVSNIVGQERKGFKEAGAHETDCCNFLKMCAHGDPLHIIEYVRRRNVNINVADARGNTAVFYAISCYRTSSLKMLINFGANLDAVNDEGLTPLNVSILHYLAWKFKVQDWEDAFLPPGLLTQEEQERFGSDSTMSLSGRIRSKKKLLSVCSKGTVSKTNPQEYIFDLSCKPVLQPAATKALSAMDLDSRLSYIEEASDVNLNLTNVEHLLQYGADPNVGEVPFPPLILALFTENDKLVKQLLEAKADISVTTEDGMNCIHIAANLRCSLENVMICEVLLSALGDPNAKTSIYHWEDEKLKIVGKGVDPNDIQDHGKNPLQLLCLRQDYDSDKCNFFEKVADLLMKAHTNLHYKYLGHTPLSLAVLSGNGKLVEYFITSGSFSPYSLLDYNMGNVLTLFTLKKYDSVLPLPKCKELIHILSRLYVNPLKAVGEFENAIAFGEYQLLPPPKPIEEQEGGKKMKKPPKKKPPKINKHSQTYIVIQYLKDCARNMIISAQMQAVERLYDLTEENLLEVECVKDLVLYLTPEIAVHCLQSLFNYGKIVEDRYSHDCIVQMLEYVDKYKVEVKKKKGAKEVKPKTKKGEKVDDQKPADTSPNFTNLLKHIDFRCKEYSKLKLKFAPPGLDDQTLYDVCFQCLLKKDKELVKCPKCRYVQFCSLPCYNQSLKEKKEKNHKCGVNMFASPVIDTSDELTTICMLAQKNCFQRYLDRKQKELEEKLKKEADERLADIYGTRYLKQKHLKSSATALLIDTHSIEGRSRKSSHTFLSCLESKLTTLSNLEKEYSSTAGRKHGISVNNAPIRGLSSKRKPKVRADACKRCCERKPNATDVVSQFEALPVLEDEYRVYKKVKAIPQKMHNFMEVLAQMFPEADFSQTILPYICYSNGQMYYRFSDHNVFAGGYSMV